MIRYRALTGFLLTILASSGSLVITSAEASGPDEFVPTVGREPAKHSLADLGQASVGLNDDATLSDGEVLTKRFVLPDAVEQGKPFWYIVNLDARVTFPAVASGSWVLSADMNGYTAASIDLDRQNGVTSVDTLSLIGGAQLRTETLASFEERFQNYAQKGGLIPGKINDLNFRLNSVGGSSGSPTIEILETSGVEVTTTSPAEIGLGTPLRVTVAPGETVEVPYEIHRRGDREVRPVSVAAHTPRPLHVVGSSRHEYPAIDRRQAGHFVVKAPAEEGTFPLSMVIGSDYNKPASNIQISVRRSDSHSGWPAAATVLFFASFVCLCLSRRLPSRG